MAIDFGQPAWLDGILDAVEVKVSAGAGLSRERVFSYAGEPVDLLDTPPAEQFVAAWFTGLPVMRDLVAGGGAATTAFASDLRLDVFARLGTDRELTDIRLLRDKSRGFGELVRKVVKAVQVWSGSADNATSPFIEPSRLSGVTFNPRKPATGWAWARVMLSVKFRTDFTV